MIDCNQHPSKKTIGFVGADQVYENVYEWLLNHIKEESSIKNISTISSDKGNPFNKNMILNFKSQSAVGQNSQIYGQKMVA
jgi:DNA mismatch repair ATPase MutL